MSTQPQSGASTTDQQRPVRFAAIGLDHAHAFGQIAGLLTVGAELVGLSSADPDAAVAKAVRDQQPDVPWHDDPQALFDDDSIDLIVTAAIPSDRAQIAIRAMRGGKDVVADKPGCTTLAQLDEIRRTVAETGRFWSVTFSERFEVPCVTKAGEIVRSGRIGEVVQTLGLGPHREGDRAHIAGGAGRPDWFYEEEQFGGILTDIASHQIDQFLWFTGSTQGEIDFSSVANVAHPDAPRMQDFGQLVLRSGNAHGYVRVDWFTPQGLPTWGDGRLFIVGTKGYMEMRKYVDIAGREGRSHLFVVDDEKTEYIDCSDVRTSYYSDLIADVRNRTETACPQAHTFEVMRLAIEAQRLATRVGYAAGPVEG